VLVGLSGCQKGTPLKQPSIIEVEGVPESLQFLIANKGGKSPFKNKKLDFTCAESISYSLTTFTSDIRPKPETRRPSYDPMIIESGPTSTIDEFRFNQYNTMPYAANDVADAIVSELGARDVFPLCKPSEAGSNINITFIEVFHFDGAEDLLPKHVGVAEGGEGEIQIAIVLSYRQLIRDYVTAKTGAYDGVNHHFTFPDFGQWAGYYHKALTGDHNITDVPSDENAPLTSRDAALNNIPPDILEFFQNTPGRTIVSYLSVANAAFKELQDRSVPVYAELMASLIQDCLNQVCPDDGEYRLRDRVSEKEFRNYIQKLSLQ
jgi:hypothetical protein